MGLFELTLPPRSATPRFGACPILAPGTDPGAEFKIAGVFPSLKNPPLKTNVFFQDLGKNFGFRLRFWAKCNDVSSKTIVFTPKTGRGWRRKRAWPQALAPGTDPGAEFKIAGVFPSLKNPPLKTNVFFQDLGKNFGFRLRFWAKCNDVSSKTMVFTPKTGRGWRRKRERGTREQQKCKNSCVFLGFWSIRLQKPRTRTDGQN